MTLNNQHIKNVILASVKLQDILVAKSPKPFHCSSHILGWELFEKNKKWSWRMCRKACTSLFLNNVFAMWSLLDMLAERPERSYFVILKSLCSFTNLWGTKSDDLHFSFHIVHFECIAVQQFPKMLWSAHKSEWL